MPLLCRALRTAHCVPAPRPLFLILISDRRRPGAAGGGAGPPGVRRAGFITRPTSTAITTATTTVAPVTVAYWEKQ